MSADAEAAELNELASLLNTGGKSIRGDRRQQQEIFRKSDAPNRSRILAMPVAEAVKTLEEFVGTARVVEAVCGRWSALVPRARQAATDAGALPAIVAGMKAHLNVGMVQEACCLALANICSGTDEEGLKRKQIAADAGALPLIVRAMIENLSVSGVQYGGAAALGNITAMATAAAADSSGLARKASAVEAGAIGAIVAGMRAHPSSSEVQEKGAFAIGNLARSVGKAGLDADSALRESFEQGLTRKRLVADEGGLGVLVAAMKEHPSHAGVLEWGARALSIVTYEMPPLREAALAAGARPQWLCGMGELMEGLKVHATPTKSGRAAFTGFTGRPTGMHGVSPTIAPQGTMPQSSRPVAVR